MNHKLTFILFLALACLTPGHLLSQSFTEIATPIMSLTGSTDWGDFDSDGDLDLLVTGSHAQYPYDAHTNIYVNNGNGQFGVLVEQNLFPIHSGTARWLDYNNDGILDIFISGLKYDALWQQYLPVTRLFKGKGNKAFEITDNVFELSGNTMVDWADINKDGTTDIALTGYTEMFPNFHGKVYENQSSSFTESMKFHIQPLILGTMRWGDYDGDQDLDLIQIGTYFDENLSQEVPATYLYRNDVDSFALIKNSGIMGTVFGSAEWGDYDRDGDLDVLVSGAVGLGSDAVGYFRLYRNVGTNVFQTIVVEGISEKVYGKSKWGDADNDGDLDVLVTGRYHEGADGFTFLYLNNDGSFVKSDSIANITASGLDWVDYDNDGDLDIFIMGSSNYTTYSKLFRNNAIQPNSPPDAPTGLRASIQKKKVHFSWSPSTDDKTDTKSLTYNLSVGSLPANSVLLSPASFLSDGYRKIVRTGNTSLDTCWDVTLQYDMRYYWQVQAIDNSFSGSAFSEVGSFELGVLYVFTDQVSDIEKISAVFNGRVNPLGLPANVFFEYGTDTTVLSVTDSELFQGDSLFVVNKKVLHLSPDTRYYYRIKAISDIDTAVGAFVSFRTVVDGIAEDFSKISVFPNPARDIVQISMPGKKDGDVLVFDAIGHLRIQLLANEVRKSGNIDIRKLESGVYTLVYAQGKYSYHVRIIKM